MSFHFLQLQRESTEIREVAEEYKPRIQLKSLPNAFPEHIQRRVSLHDLGHGLLDERFDPGEPVAERAEQVIGQVHADEEARGGGVDGHVVGRVVQELGSGVALHVVRVVVAPSQLYVYLRGAFSYHNCSNGAVGVRVHYRHFGSTYPVFLRGGGVHDVLGVSEE